MATFKFTFLFDWQSRAGWTETWYSTVGGTPPSNFRVLKAESYANARAKVLTNGATILSCRVSEVTTPRAVSIVMLGLKGALGQGIIFNDKETDVVNLAQLVSFNSVGDERRHFLQRGLDDRDIVEGQITYIENGMAKSRRFWDFLRDNSWSMKDYIKSAMQPISSVNGSTKKVLVTDGTAYPAGSVVLVNSRTAGNGLRMDWQGKVKSTVGNLVELQGYRYGDAVGGFIWLLTPSYPDLTEWVIPTPNWCRTRQTGRPFNLPRGRAPKRT